MSSVIIVSNRLPVTVGDTIVPSSGGLVSAMEGFTSGDDFQWIGWAGAHIKDAGRRAALRRELLAAYHYYPIFLESDEIKDYYIGFANSSLWPLLHYKPSYAHFDHQWYEMYRRVNARFAEEVDARTPVDRTVWIHDYHLMLLPAMLRQRRPDLRIGFFLHTPFPSYEVFRCHPSREVLVQGMLGADLIGFHTTDYLRHFRNAVLRILGLESQINTIRTETHQVAIDVFPISIPVERFRQELQSDRFQEHLQQYREIYKTKKVVLSVERLDYTKGVPRRLEAIERFLNETGRRDVIFIFISVPSRESVTAYRNLRREIEHKVSNINGQFATITGAPIHFIHQSVSFTELCALYRLADVAMVTPDVDGMNVVAKEYVICQADGHGALILSEFAGAAHELHQAYIVNPYHVDAMARTLSQALDAPPAEKRRRLQAMQDRVSRYHARRWAESFIGALERSAAASDGIAEPRRLGHDILRDFWQSTHAALFLDYDGTLIPLRKDPAEAVPDNALHRLFARMQSVLSGRIDVYLMSNREPQDMDRWFGGYDMHLIAEHGLYYRHPTAGEWARFDNNADLSWMPAVFAILEQYADLTPGSEIEKKTASLVWHYRHADPEFGRWKAHQMVDELRELLTNLPVTIHHGVKVVEVNSIMVNKGVIFRHLKTLNAYERTLCAGDDETDESMFRKSGGLDITIKVGDGETLAKYSVVSPLALRELIASTLPEIPRES